MQVLRLVCSCLKNAPATDTWDLQHMQIEGQPVTADTVAAVVEAIYHIMHAMDMEMEQTPGRFSLLQYRDMLLFADAAGCSRRLLRSIAELLEPCVRKQLEMAVPKPTAVGNEATNASATKESAEELIVLQLDHVYMVHIWAETRWVLWDNTINDSIADFKLKTGRDGMSGFNSAVARQLESLLYTAFKLDIQPLQLLLVGFMQRNRYHEDSILTFEPLNTTFSARMLSAAGSSDVGGGLLARAMLQVPFGLGMGLGSIFADVDCDDLPMVSFSATLTRDLIQYKKGSRVQVDLDVGDGTMKIQVLTSAGDASASATLQFGIVAGRVNLEPDNVRVTAVA